MTILMPNNTTNQKSRRLRAFITFDAPRPFFSKHANEDRRPLMMMAWRGRSLSEKVIIFMYYAH